MGKRFKACLLSAGIAALAGLPAAAHHSFAMFDATTEVTAEGTVVDFHWTNPHSWLDVMIPDPNGSGEMQEWGLELAGPAMMARLGWTPTTFQAGDQLTVTFHPMKDGSQAGQYLQAELPDGRVLATPRLPGSAPAGY